MARRSGQHQAMGSRQAASNVSGDGSMWVKLSGFAFGLNSATSSRSNRLAPGIRGPERYSANADLWELGICHDTSSGTRLD